MKLVEVDYYYNGGKFKSIVINPAMIETIEANGSHKGVQSEIVFQSGTRFLCAQDVYVILSRINAAGV